MYLYGGPGCGKTFVSDLFMATLSKSFSKRVHFHAFMMETHGELHRLAQMNKKTNNISNEDTAEVVRGFLGGKSRRVVFRRVSSD